MSEQSITQAVDGISADLKALDARIAQASLSLADAYKALVGLIADNAGVFTDETGKLKAGVLDNVTRIAPHVNKGTFSSAWSAFKAAPDEFAQAQAVSHFQKIVKEHKTGSPDKSDMSKALSAVQSAIQKAANAGISAGTIADLIRAAYKPAQASKPVAQAQPAPEQPVAQAEQPAPESAPVVIDVIESPGAKKQRKTAQAEALAA